MARAAAGLGTPTCGLMSAGATRGICRFFAKERCPSRTPPDPSSSSVTLASDLVTSLSGRLAPDSAILSCLPGPAGYGRESVARSEKRSTHLSPNNGRLSSAWPGGEPSIHDHEPRSSWNSGPPLFDVAMPLIDWVSLAVHALKVDLLNPRSMLESMNNAATPFRLDPPQNVRQASGPRGVLVGHFPCCNRATVKGSVIHMPLRSLTPPTPTPATDANPASVK